jgi:hypothetical protein
MLDVSKRDWVLFILFLLSLVLISSQIGKIIPIFFLALITIIIFAFIDALIHIKSFNLFLLHRVKEISFALSFSILATIIFATILPYLLFHNYFLNIFVIQYIYVLPVLIFFFASFYLFGHIIPKYQIDYKQMIKWSLIISIILSIILSVVLVISINIGYETRTNQYNRGYESEVNEFLERTEYSYPDMPIFNEIKSHRENILSDADQKHLFLWSFNKNLCITNDCMRNVVDKVHHLVEVVVNFMVFESNFEDADEELKFINENKFVNQFNTLENYSLILQQRVDSLNYEFEEMSVEQKALLTMVESDFDYNDFKSIIQREDQDSLGGWGDMMSLQSGPLFYESLSYVMTHSTISQELVRLVVKINLFSEQISKNREFLIEVYQNKDSNESIKSKTIRNKLILARIDPIFLEDLYNNKS